MSETISQATQDFFLNLYNGYSGIAERVPADQWSLIHVDTDLQNHIVSWLRNKQDIILTGNPGDGKTHLMEVVLSQLDKDEINFKRDASQENAQAILTAWEQSKGNNKPFLLAINHAPLRNLAREAKNHPTLDFLYQAIFPEQPYQSEMVSFIIYSKEQNEYFRRTSQPIMLIDLSMRATLTDKNLLGGLLDKLCKIAEGMSCEEGLPLECSRCPIHYNTRALQDEQIRERLFAIFELLSKRGNRATVRDLLSCFVFILTRGVECQNLWPEEKKCYDNDYYSLLFDANARSALFDAIRETFDPGEYADPKIDVLLWTNETEILQWFDDENPAQPANLRELQTLKRRVYFEQQDSVDTQFARMLPEAEKDFYKLLDSMQSSKHEVEKLVEKINLFYAPLGKESQAAGYRFRLRLWNKHRYAVGGVANYFAMRTISAERLTIYHPNLNNKYQDAMPIHQDHVLLAVHDWLPGDPALRIDWEMFQALNSARNGKPIVVQPYHILRRLDLFLRQLGNEVGKTDPVETIEWIDHLNRKVISINVKREDRSYMEQ